MTYSKETIISLMKLNASYLADAEKEDEVVCVFDIIQSLKWKLDDIIEAEQQEKSAPTAATVEADKENTSTVLSANGQKLSIGDWVYSPPNYIGKIVNIKNNNVVATALYGSDLWPDSLYKLESCSKFEVGHQVLTSEGYGKIISAMDNNQYKIELDNGGMVDCEPWELWERPKLEAQS